MKLLPLSLIVGSLLLTASCGGGGGEEGGLPVSLAQTLAIDGVIDFAALGTPQQATLDYLDGFGAGSTFGKSTTLRWIVVNDDRFVYVALEWNDATNDTGFDLTSGPTDFDGVKLIFDQDADGLFEVGEDERTVIAATVGSQYVDQHGSLGDETDLIGDGIAKLTWDAGTEFYQAEFLLPIADDTNGEDGGLNALSRYSILLFDHVQIPLGTGNVATLHGVLPVIGADASSWDDFPLATSGPHTHAELPDNLTGLITFISAHENPRGDIYTFDPATRITTRVTNDPALFKENVSLSHDRTRIAYHATPDDQDPTLFEIWTVNVDGSNPTQLTNNAILDGHPAWSLDDTRIAYASFREAKASIVIMQADGTEILDLTPVGIDDNDPEFLPDGRIVFKTDRWSTNPEVRIAVMDPDGTNVEQLTSVASVSDHDPVGDGTKTIFERFNKDTNFATDVESGFTPWDLIEANLDGSGETILLADGFLNWLPVYDPSGQYVLYLKSIGYTEARLLTRSGVDLGRLIPDMTRVEYLDWK